MVSLIYVSNLCIERKGEAWGVWFLVVQTIILPSNFKRVVWLFWKTDSVFKTGMGLFGRSCLSLVTSIEGDTIGVWMW